MIPGLLITEGPQKGRFIEIPENKPFWCGRDEKTDLVLKNQQSVSAHHCSFLRQGSQLEFFDQSSNGSQVNGFKVHREKKLLKITDIIRIGEVHFQIADFAPFDETPNSFSKDFEDYAKRGKKSYFFPDWETSPYFLIELIGMGYNSKVFKALHSETKELVALKIFFQLDELGSGFIARFNREIQLLRQLKHLFIVDLKDNGVFPHKESNEELHFIAIEYFQGTNLKAYLEQYGPMSWEVVFSLIIQAVQGLHYMHIQGVIHRDLKPSNIIYDPINRRMKIIDLGLGKCISQEQRNSIYTTASNSSLGTPHFMPIEQWSNAKKADERSDIYSLGATAYFLLTGAVPYEQHHSFNKILDALFQKDLIPIEELLKTEVPRDLLKIVKNMMAFDSKNRYDSCEVILQKLTKVAKKLKFELTTRDFPNGI